MKEFLENKKYQTLSLFFIFTFLLIGGNFIPTLQSSWPEEWTIGFADWINTTLIFLQDEFWIIEVMDIEEDIEEGIPLVMIITRGISDSIQLLIDILRNILLGGRKGFGLPALPWTVLAITGIVVGYALKGWRLSLLAGLSIAYLAIFGQWKVSMQTLSLVAIAAPISLFFGFIFGLLGYKYKKVEYVLSPLLNIAQSLPHFSYLIPVVVFYGIGDHAGAIATIIFASPPMIRLTLLGLKKIPTEILESGKMSGCNTFQLLLKVQIPSARTDLMIGVNQVIMQCLAMVVIASFIGASGLGYDLLVMLNGLKIGKALELGVSIVLIAVVLDKLSLAWAYKLPDYRSNLPFYLRYKYQLIWGILVLLSLFLSYFTPYAYLIPENSAITTAFIWDWGVDWIVINWSSSLEIFRDFLLADILIPMRDFYLGLPIIAVLFLVAGVGYIVGGFSSASIVLGFWMFILLSGWWEKAMITLYMVNFAVIVAVIFGFLLGVYASRGSKRSKAVLLLCDTLQTFPSFVYLIPVIMLFQVNDVSVITAVIIYASIPATRYTIEGLCNITEDLQDAASMSGVNWIQRLFKIELPLAFPHILIGINQTVLFALVMVILGAFIGTQDLGQEIMQALSENDMGKGLVLGLCVALIGLAIDHLIMKWSWQRKRDLGLV